MKLEEDLLADSPTFVNDMQEVAVENGGTTSAPVNIGKRSNKSKAPKDLRHAVSSSPLGIDGELSF